MRGNTITYFNGVTTRFEYDDTYYHVWMTGSVSYIYTTYRYEFKDNGNELHLYWVPNVYGVKDDEHKIFLKVGD